jgi:hypothetical protein
MEDSYRNDPTFYNGADIAFAIYDGLVPGEGINCTEG